MKCFLLLFAILAATTVAAQTNLQDWTAVKNIPIGSDIWVKARGGNVTGTFLSADDEQLRIEPHGHTSIFRRRAATATFPRAQVREVRLARRFASAAVGTALGVGLGTAAGLALESQYPDHTEDGHLAAGVFAFLGGMVGEVVGEHTAFIHGARIYRAP